MTRRWVSVNPNGKVNHGTTYYASEEDCWRVVVSANRHFYETLELAEARLRAAGWTVVPVRIEIEENDRG